MLETKRLILRRWKESDLSPFAAINADPKVMEFLGPPLPVEKSCQMIQKFEDGFEEHDFGLYAAELKETDTLIGFIGCAVPNFEAPFLPCIEIGWRLGSAHSGWGLATEGARAVLTDIFLHPGINEIVSFTTILNRKSISVMKKLGMHSDPRDDFNHPKLSTDNPLRPHVLYRLNKNNR